MKKNILILDDDSFYRMYLSQLFQNLATCIEAFDEVSFRQVLAEHNITLAIVDLNFDGKIKGLNFAKILQQHKIPFVILSAEDCEKLTEEAYSLGCLDFLTKGLESQYIPKLKRYLENDQNERTNRIKNHFATTNEKMINNISQLVLSFDGGLNALIIGETGSGKGHLAKFLYNEVSKSNDEPFIAINCATIPQNLFESEIFGHKKGSFSGADQDKIGLLQSADGGILFLDEICSLNIEHQAKLLKVIEEKEYYPVGSTKKVKVNFKLITACQPAIHQKIRLQQFRVDLFYRLAGASFTTPALSERKNDISLLVRQLSKIGRKIIIKDDAIEYLSHLAWKGNIRELTQLIQVLQTKEQGIYNREDIINILSNNIADQVDQSSTSSSFSRAVEVGLKQFMQELQRNIVHESFKRNHKNVRKTVEELKISFSTFYKNIEKNSIPEKQV